MEIYISCGHGLEPLLIEELAELGYTDVEAGSSGVYATVDKQGIYRINYESRIASRVLLPLLRFDCRGSKSLYDAMLEIDWQNYVRPGKTIAIDANVSHPDIRNSLFAAQTVKDAICDQLREKTGERPSVDLKNPDVQLNLFIRDNDGIIYFDTSGAPLTRRGYRMETVEAPVSENLAAAMLRIARYQGSEILCDPCCGSGTFLIEAAMLASKTPPGFLRQKWGFMGLPDYDASLWQGIKAKADAERVALRPGHFMGCDSNPQAVAATKTNLAFAGFLSNVDVKEADFRNYTPAPEPKFVIVNPPHGMRLGNEEALVPLYRSLGDFFKKKCAKPAKAFLFTSSKDLSKQVGLAAKKRHIVHNSGVESRLLEFDLF
jgi:putative N6-adenine-specific DNA methylase